METPLHAYGRTELAQKYFPNISPQAAWHKLRQLLMEHDRLQPLATMHRRTLTVREVGDVFSLLGAP